MKVIEAGSVKRIKEARLIIEDLQSRLLQCEMRLEDLARCAEIVQITNQFQLMSNFIDAANEYLKDKLELPELDSSGMKIQIITDDSKTVSNQPS